MLIYNNIKNSSELFFTIPYSLFPFPYSLLPAPCSLFPTPVLMQSLMGETPKTALHRYSLLPTPFFLNLNQDFAED
ncbi:hypothetical protein [Moorena producens]|uniref:hypothetical protein n=1 Tax=Moorena producens TaxID=1155739 RepID=UPI003C7408CC